MIVIDTGWQVCRYRVVYFPSADMVDLVLNELGVNQLIRVRQTRGCFDNHPNLLRRSIFKAVCIDLTNTLDTLEKRMDSTCRRWLRKAEKAGTKIEIRVNDESTYDDFIGLYNGFALKHRHSGPVSRKRLAGFAGVSDLFVAYYEGRPACGHLWLRDEVSSRVRLMFSASSRLESRDDANVSGLLNRHLHWMEIAKYRREGFDLYDMGGFENDADFAHSLTRFKLSLGGFILPENNYCFGSGLAAMAYRMFDLLPDLSPWLRGRLPA